MEKIDPPNPHMAPMPHPPTPPRGGGPSLFGRKNFFRNMIFEKKVIKKCQTKTRNVESHHVERNFNDFTSGKESQRNFCHFGPKIIENGLFGVEI